MMGNRSSDLGVDPTQTRFGRVGVGQVGEESAARESVPCPVGYRCRRLTSAVCLEYARKLFAGQTFWLVTGL